MANVANGVFDIVDDALTELRAAQLPKSALEQFSALMARAQVKEISEGDLEKRAAEIDPKLGLLVKTIRGRGIGFFGAVLLVLMLALSHCQFDVNISVDVNKLVDRAVEHLEKTEEPDLRNKVQYPERNHQPASSDAASDGTNGKSPNVEHGKTPSRRRSDVNRGRRTALRRRREQFPQRKRK
ncbi:hypothetical protein [Mesorhizobium sp. CA7]|uniref:hypothetical protein n=1 Tax=Mesorhizobium sp. CA7 TaxID=588501 RepID=UPI001CCAC474|nr:hypothetical protein [Mesorhizobium sp. CA7]MBZ9816938.1 hypothetical protein [Mesorhizobium sp. CA7]